MVSLIIASRTDGFLMPGHNAIKVQNICTLKWAECCRFIHVLLIIAYMLNGGS